MAKEMGELSRTSAEGRADRRARRPRSRPRAAESSLRGDERRVARRPRARRVRGDRLRRAHRPARSVAARRPAARRGGDDHRARRARHRARRAHARALTARDDGPGTAAACPVRHGRARGGRRSRVARSRRAAGLARRATPRAAPCGLPTRRERFGTDAASSPPRTRESRSHGTSTSGRCCKAWCTSACARTSVRIRRAARSRSARMESRCSDADVTIPAAVIGGRARGRCRRIGRRRGQREHRRPRSRARIEPRRSAPRMARRAYRGHRRRRRRSISAKCGRRSIANGAAMSGPLDQRRRQSCASRRMGAAGEGRSLARAPRRRRDAPTRSSSRGGCPRSARRTATAGASTGACRCDEPQAAARARPLARADAAPRRTRPARRRHAAATERASPASTRCAAARCA